MVGQYNTTVYQECGKMTKTIQVGKSVLETITVALYENPIILFREYVQNSIDAYNKAILEDKKPELKDFHVTIDIDEKGKKIIIKDNGYGIYDKELFEIKMLSIGSSEKTQDRTRYIGFRGIGRISGLAFCDKLTFKNKILNSNKIQECIWEGNKYRDLLNTDSTHDDLQSIVKKITGIYEKDIENSKTSEHYFEVTLENYTEDIVEVLKDNKFKDKLIKMLPLKYKKEFKGAKKIINKYNTFIANEDIERFTICVKFNNDFLYKKYDDSFMLGSDIVFWEIRGKKKKNGAPGDKIGLLWFTFEKHLKTNTKNEYYGILTRSKNVLMGTNDTFAQVADNNKEYITTFREMAQTLRGIYGELLINSPNLRDNSRRDWFLPDQYSIELNNVITEFMKRLHNYRYCASKYFRDNPTKKKEDLKIALDELVNIQDNEINYDYFYKKEIKTTNASNVELLSEQDIPYENLSAKKYYDILMKVIEDFFDKDNNRVLFLKLRAYIANHFKKP